MVVPKGLDMKYDHLMEIVRRHGQWYRNEPEGERAYLVHADLRGVNLSRANLAEADLSGADLTEVFMRAANLICTDLRGANLTRAYLRRTDLMDANLCGAHLCGADLMGADLRGANLTGADLRGANLNGAILNGANFRGADLDGAVYTTCSEAVFDEDGLAVYRDDILAVLRDAVDEVPAVLAALREGRVDGSSYTGNCSCLLGTIATARECDVYSLDIDENRPAELWFRPIRPGDTPGTSPRVAEIVRWIEAWQKGSAQWIEAWQKRICLDHPCETVFMTLTDEEIKLLRYECGTGGDIQGARTCERALGWTDEDWDEDDLDVDPEIRSMSVEDARRWVAEQIAWTRMELGT